MKRTQPIDATHARDSAVLGSQFRLRDVFIVLTFAAVALAATAPWLRNVTARQWWSFGICAVVGFIGTALATWLWRWQDRRAMRQVGDILWQTPRIRSRSRLQWRDLRYAVFGLFTFVNLVPLFFALQASASSPLIGKTVCSALLNPLVISLFLRDGGNIVVGTGGVVRSSKFYRWTSLQVKPSTIWPLKLHCTSSAVFMLDCPNEELRDQTLAVYQAAKNERPGSVRAIKASLPQR